MLPILLRRRPQRSVAPPSPPRAPSSGHLAPSTRSVSALSALLLLASASPVLVGPALATEAAPADRRQIVAPPGTDVGLPFSAAVWGGDLLYLSGALANDPGTKNVSGDTKAQAHKTLDNLKVVLDAAGLDWSRVVDTRLYLSDSRYFADAAAVYAEVVGNQPARTTVEADIAIPEARLEMSMIAARKGVEIREIVPEGWPADGGAFSWGVMAGDSLFVAGMLAVDPKSGRFLGGDITAQTRKTMENIGAVLDAAGLGFDDLTRCRVFLADPRDYGAMNEAYGSFMGEAPPARATVRSRLMHPEAKIEVQCAAVRSDDRRIVAPAGATPSGRPFSPSVAVDGKIFLAGMVGRVDGAYADGVEAQTRATLENLRVTLEAAGLGFRDVIDAVVYLTDVRDYDIMNRVYAEVVGTPAPARATVGTPLMSPRALVEIQMTALLPDTDADPAADGAEGDESASLLRGRTEPVVLGTAHRFRSQVMDEERVLNVLLPPSYSSEPERTYPVIYLLDGAIVEDYHHVSGLVQFLTTYQLMPESILVGIANTDRYRDFTPPTTDEEALARIPNAGGSDRFIHFVRTEVQPYVEKSFRTTGTRTVIGQSLGGLMATEMFLEAPELFEQYLIVSPSLWWDHGSMAEAIDGAMKAQPERAEKLVLSLGTEGEEMQKGTDSFIAALEAHAPASLEWHYLPLPEESHATILHRAIYQGMELIYGDEFPGMGRDSGP